MFDKRIPNAQQKEQKKIHNFFFFGSKGSPNKDPVEEGKLDLSNHRRRFKKSRRRFCATLPITLKDFALITISFSVGNWATLKQTVGKERLIIFIRDCERSLD